MKELLVRLMGFFFGVEATEPNSSSIPSTRNVFYLYLGKPLTGVPIKTNTDKTREFFARAVNLAVRHIFSSRYYPKIGPGIVKSIPVDMVNLQTSQWFPHNRMVKKNVEAFFGGLLVKISSGVGVPIPSDIEPFVFRKVGIAIINQCSFPTAQLNFDHAQFYKVR